MIESTKSKWFLWVVCDASFHSPSPPHLLKKEENEDFFKTRRAEEEWWVHLCPWAPVDVTARLPSSRSSESIMSRVAHHQSPATARCFHRLSAGACSPGTLQQLCSATVGQVIAQTGVARPTSFVITWCHPLTVHINHFFLCNIFLKVCWVG